MLMKTCRKYRVEGRVQGVWFRESTRKQALALNIRGHAINCADGSVEVLACGDADALVRLAKWLRQGPPLAVVRAVIESDYDGDCPDGFVTG